MNIPGGALGRDGCRTPMQWEANDHAGFSEVEPWLPVSDDFRTRNVAASAGGLGIDL
jgi:alpha-glucosidase